MTACLPGDDGLQSRVRAHQGQEVRADGGQAGATRTQSGGSAEVDAAAQAVIIIMFVLTKRRQCSAGRCCGDWCARADAVRRDDAEPPHQDIFPVRGGQELVVCVPDATSRLFFDTAVYGLNVQILVCQPLRLAVVQEDLAALAVYPIVRNS